MDDRLDGLVSLSSVYTKQQFSDPRPAPTTCSGIKLGGEYGREEEAKDENKSGAVCIVLPKAILSFCPYLTLTAFGTKLSSYISPALGGRGMLFIQFGAGRRGRKSISGPDTNTLVAIKAGLWGT
jgi:hypothetical protein